MKKINISSIVLAILFVVSLVMLVVFFLADTENQQLSNGQYQEVSTFLDPFLYWAYVVVGLGIVLLLVFAVKTFLTDMKAGLQGLISIAILAAILVGCYLFSGETEFTRIVNGETEVYSESTMKMIDMWLYSIYILTAGTVVLFIGFAVKRAIIK
jgi:hydrogenase-4 membrane subunit HyfE